MLVVLPRNLSSNSATFVVTAAAVCFGAAPLFAKGLLIAGIASPSIAFYRFLLSALALLPFLAISRSKRGPTLWAILSGVGVGLGWIGYVEALKSAPVSTAGVVYMTYPLFTLLIASVWLRQFPKLRSIAGGVLILCAAMISLSPAAVPPEAAGALVLSFSAPLAFGFAITVLTVKLHGLAPLERTAAFSLGAVLGLLPLIVTLEAEQVIVTEPGHWALIAGISFITALAPNILFALAAPFIGPSRTAMASSFELPTMFLVGWLAFGELINAVQVFAGLLVITAILTTPFAAVPIPGHNASSVVRGSAKD